MAHISADRVQETTVTTGTGAITLAGAANNFVTFASRMATNDTCWYALVDGTNNAWETGLGTLTSSTTLARTTVLRSSNANALVDFAAGTKNVFMTLPGDKSFVLDPDNSVSLPGITTEPLAPTAGNLKLYSKLIAGRMSPKIIGPSGIDTPIQNAFWQNNIVMWTPTTASTGLWVGTAGAGTGTYASILPSFTNLYTAVKRSRYANVVTTLNQQLGQRGSEAMFFLGNSAGQGGFFYYARGGCDIWTNGGRFFAGLSVNNSTVTGEASASSNIAGFCIESTDAGLISFITRSTTTTTKTSTGFTMTSNSGYDFYIFNAPNSASVSWRIVNLNNNTEASGTHTTNLPAVNTNMIAMFGASNGALTPVNSIQVGVNRIYIETDK